MAAPASNVRVCCRFRPFNQREQQEGGKPILQIDPDCRTVVVKGRDGNPLPFTFDYVFKPESSQKQVFEYSARPIIDDIMKGYNGTLFVYGQTSSGKTHTMQGPDIDDEELKGIIPRMNDTIFETVRNADPNTEFTVKASYIEIYMERIRDLLDPSRTNLAVREDKTRGVWVEDASEVYVCDQSDVLNAIRDGSRNRAIAETKMNQESSRSHSVFILTVLQKNLTNLSTKTGKLYLVDLAGSEKVEKTGATGSTLDEAKMINKSLSALGNVINALTDGKSQHIPYRDSKLTRVLQESLGGNSRTTLIINCSPSTSQEAETISTLRFGTRAKSIQNKAKVNVERSAAELKAALELAEKEINKLKATIGILEDELKKGGRSLPSGHQRTSSESAAVIDHLPATVALQEKVLELEEQLKRKEEIELALTDQKEHEAEVAEQLREELGKLQTVVEEKSMENDFMVAKFAEMSLKLEKAQFEGDDARIMVEKLNQQISALKQERDNDRLELETAQAKYIAKAEEAARWAEAAASQKAMAASHSGRDADLRVTDLEGLSTAADASAGGDLHVLVQRQQQEIEELKRQREMQQAILDRLTQGDEQPPSAQGAVAAIAAVPELLNSSGQSFGSTSMYVAQFDELKQNLLRDLENRCKKVVELEILLDEAREQYHQLLSQQETPTVKGLHEKNRFLQRQIDEMTTVQQALIKENNQLKLDNQVSTKQLAIRNERIHGLELLLQDSQDKLQKLTSGDASAATNPNRLVRNPSGTASRPQPIQQQGGARMAKPMRGGGHHVPEESTPERTQSKRSLWSIFTGSGPSTPSTPSTPPGPYQKATPTSPE